VVSGDQPARRLVVHYTDAVVYGGAERMLLTLLEGLDRQRWFPLLYHHGGPAIAPLLEGARAVGVETRIVPCLRGRRGLARVPALVRQIRTDDPAVFHAHLPWRFRCSRGLVAARLARVPAVVATQQLFAAPSSRGAVLRHRLLSMAVDRYIAVSNDMARALRPLCVRADRRLTVVHNAVRADVLDAAPDRRRVLPEAAGRPVVLTLARLDAQKGLEYLIGAADLLPDALFLIAGDGGERRRLEALTREKGLAGRVRFLGYRDDASRLLAACDVFVLPSLFEGLPVSVLEAMAAGRPVVGTAIPGTDEAVLHGRTGLLVPPADSVALAGAIKAILSDPTLARRLGEAGRERVQQHFSATRMVERVVGVYEELLAAKHRVGRG
jgi:glycosyltransferase involved in cell wall biosynthesis